MNILFWIYRSRLNHQGLAPVMLRITINGKRLNLVTGIEIPPELWDKDKQKVRGGCDLHKQYNKQLLIFKTKAWDFYTASLTDNSLFTFENLKHALLGKEKREYSLMDAINYQINHLQSRVGLDISLSTIKKYHTIKRKVIEFLQRRFGKEDLSLSQVNHQVIFEFDHFMRVEQRLHNNGVIKNMQQLKRIIRIAIQNEWMSKDPFEKYKMKVSEPKRIFLTQEELFRFQHCELPSERLQRVRDLFIFSCYTGLAYADVSKLSANNFHLINGKEWIILDRTKTKNQSTVPFLPQAKAILEQYALKKNNQHILPVISSQNINKYLKEVAEIAEINKPISFHAARHTFASTVTLNNGVDISTVSAMLGHRMIKTTQIYAKVNMVKIAKDVQALYERGD